MLIMVSNLHRITWAVFIAWSILILTFSLRRVGGGTAGGAGNSVFEHLFAYAVFAFLLFLVLRDYGVKQVYLIVISTAFVYGLWIETLQIIFPWRNFSLFDSLLNLIGSSLIVLLKPFAT